MPRSQLPLKKAKARSCASKTMAPIELVGLAWSKSEGYIGLRQCRTALLAPTYRIAANRVVAPAITKSAQFFEQPNKRQPFACRLIFVRKQQAIQPIPPWPDFGKWLRRAFVTELGRIRADACSAVGSYSDRIARSVSLN
jgi:hypothetical protein